MFLTALGLAASDAEYVREALLRAAATEEAVLTGADEYGAHYQLDFTLTRGKRTAQVRSSWIVRRGEDFPRMTSCYVL